MMYCKISRMLTGLAVDIGLEGNRTAVDINSSPDRYRSGCRHSNNSLQTLDNGFYDFTSMLKCWSFYKYL